jgi:hypothetical protein
MSRAADLTKTTGEQDDVETAQSRVLFFFFLALPRSDIMFA